MSRGPDPSLGWRTGSLFGPFPCKPVAGRGIGAVRRRMPPEGKKPGLGLVTEAERHRHAQHVDVSLMGATPHLRSSDEEGEK